MTEADLKPALLPRLPPVRCLFRFRLAAECVRTESADRISHANFASFSHQRRVPSQACTPFPGAPGERAGVRATFVPERAPRPVVSRPSPAATEQGKRGLSRRKEEPRSGNRIATLSAQSDRAPVRRDWTFDWPKSLGPWASL